MDKKVLAVGDVVLDRYVFGTADRLSPEAVVPVLRVSSERMALGAAGHVAAVAAAQGVQAGLVWVRGRVDLYAGVVATLLPEHKVWERSLEASVYRYHVPRCSRFVADGRQLLRCDDRAEAALSGTDAARLTAEVRGLLSEVGVLALVDYGLGALTAPCLHDLVTAAAAAGVTTVARVVGDGSAYRGVSVAVMPWDTAAKLYGRGGERPGDPVAAGGFVRSVVGALYCEHAVIDAGQYGLFWGERATVGRAQPVRVMPADRPVVDPAGAPDALLGVLAAELCRGTPVAEALVRANAAAAEAAARVGTVVVLRHEVDAALARHPAGGHKVMTTAAVKAAAEVWRLIGRRVGCVVADFNRIDVDAVRLVAEAAAECDSLVVVVTDPLDPVGDVHTLPLETRVEMLAALGYPAAVTGAPGGTELAAVRAARPDVLVVQPGWATGRAADYVTAHGGRVVTAAHRA